jgi:hypothetical protein
MAKTDSGKAARIADARKHWEDRAIGRPKQVFNPETKEWSKVK